MPNVQPTTRPDVRPVADAAATECPSAKEADAVEGGFESILIADDNPAVRTLARHILSSFGYHVIESGSADQALQICRAEPGPIQVLLTDVVMPRMSGFELARLATQARPSLKVIFMSGYPHSNVEKDGVTQTTGAFLQKPFTPLQLDVAVRKVLDQS